MSFSVGAALKKVAVSLLTDKKVLKWAGGIVLGALIIIMIPFAVIISLGSGQIKIDTEGLKAAVKAELNAEDQAKSEQIDKILGQISSKMKAKYRTSRLKPSKTIRQPATARSPTVSTGFPRIPRMNGTALCCWTLTATTASS